MEASKFAKADLNLLENVGAKDIASFANFHGLDLSSTPFLNDTISNRMPSIFRMVCL